ncbi:hypothetical protein PG993_007854 [Apiospora rasikravindrae]|uniref:Uncharacterized protein n=1 Tax=Apiospora rasikravindrae TaxID=990691 RepID=A0ABR1SYP6_9PEZI
MFKGRPNPGRSLLLSFILLCLCFLILLYHHHAAGFDSQAIAIRPAGDTAGSRGIAEPPAKNPEEHPLHHPPPSVDIVAASLQTDNTAWFHRHLPLSWRKHIYTVDDSRASLTVPKNKGREAMVYLTHIVNNYDSLAETTIFFHAARFAWHNDDPDYDAVPTLRRLRLEHVRREGYVNLRCVWVIGCPEEIHPHLDAEEARRLDSEAGSTDEEKPPTTTKAIYKTAFQELLQGVPVPDVVAVSCCSQFAVTREAIRRRPREDYVRFRDWLLSTPLTDDLSGRVMEFAWHIIFGKESVHCPSTKDCYCNLWGLCGDDMTCTDGACEGRYTLPGLANLPDHWPLLGWAGENRNFTGPLD